MTQLVALASSVGGQSPQICRHRWVIEPANGPLSQGVCQTCGEVREFKNSIEESSWYDYRLFTLSEDESWAEADRAASRYVEIPNMGKRPA